jgi:hypothetical protein
MKKPEQKKFEYIPRYYKPDKDEAQKFKDKFEIVRKSYSFKKKNNRLVFYFILVLVIIYLAIRFGFF